MAKIPERLTVARINILRRWFDGAGIPRPCDHDCGSGRFCRWCGKQVGVKKTTGKENFAK